MTTRLAVVIALFTLFSCREPQPGAIRRGSPGWTGYHAGQTSNDLDAGED